MVMITSGVGWLNYRKWAPDSALQPHLLFLPSKDCINSIRLKPVQKVACTFALVELYAVMQSLMTTLLLRASGPSLAA